MFLCLPFPSRRGYVFTSTNHLLGFTMNFLNALSIGLSFITICYEFAIGWIIRFRGGPYWIHMLLFWNIVCFNIYHYLSIISVFTIVEKTILLWVNNLESSLENVNCLKVNLNIVSMGPDLSVLIFFSIEVNVEVYHRAGRGWTNVVSTFVTENNCMSSQFMTLISTWFRYDNCIH